ncbi:MAG: signal recognition particle-docking protein FtsY [Acidobacteria bacterium]|nr:MAG: signal recognition particle-docking protein FtsY [Acidobacteriota bacterium]
MAFLDTFSKLFSGLERTRRGIAERLGEALRPGRPIDESAFEELEEALIESDVGPGLAAQVVQGVRRRARGPAGSEELAGLVREELKALLRRDPAAPPAAAAATGGGLRVILIVGVNGGGKTTTAGKLAARYQAEGLPVVLAAADTFRAAAIEQLEIWAQRAGALLIRHGEGADPSAVVFDAARAALRRGARILLVDTAGRLHTRSNLMQELEKITRVAGREVPGAPHEVLLVLDATTGQNGLSQAREFLRAAKVTGVVLTKLDGTARGGIALAIAQELGLPLRYVGVGEKLEDLVDFDPDAYVAGLLGQQPVSAAPAKGEATA